MPHARLPCRAADPPDKVSATLHLRSALHDSVMQRWQWPDEAMLGARRIQTLAHDIAPSKNWAFPKFYLMCQFEQAIERFGSANWCSTAFGKRSHKNMKSQAAFTNGREEQVDLQVRRGLMCGSSEAISSIVA